MKAIRQAQTREILDAYDKGEISYSRMNEMFNELADKFAIGFAEHIQNIGFNKLTQKGYDNKTVMWFSHKKGIGATTNELLDSYKRNL